MAKIVGPGPEVEVEAVGSTSIESKSGENSSATIISKERRSSTSSTISSGRPTDDVDDLQSGVAATKVEVEAEAEIEVAGSTSFVTKLD